MILLTECTLAALHPTPKEQSPIRSSGSLLHRCCIDPFCITDIEKKKTIQEIPFHLFNFIFRSKIRPSPSPRPPPPSKKSPVYISPHPGHQHQTSNSHTGSSHRPIISDSSLDQQFSHSDRSINTGQHINLPRPTPATSPFTKSVRFSRSRCSRRCRSECCNSGSSHAGSKSFLWAWRSCSSSASFSPSSPSSSWV